MLVTLPLSLFPASQLLERLLFPEDLDGSHSRALKLLLRPVLTTLVVIVGTSVDSLGALTGFVGATLMMAMGFVVPVRMYEAAHALSSPQPGTRLRKGSILNWAICLAAMSVAFIQCTKSLG